MMAKMSYFNLFTFVVRGSSQGQVVKTQLLMKHNLDIILAASRICQYPLVKPLLPNGGR